MLLSWEGKDGVNKEEDIKGWLEADTDGKDIVGKTLGVSEGVDEDIVLDDDIARVEQVANFLTATRRGLEGPGSSGSSGS